MPQGYTISPVSDEQGNIVDFDVDGGYDGFRSSSEDIVEFNDGSRHHVFEDASIDEGEFTTDSYYETLAASDERIPAALEWAAGNLPPELITEYNESLDNDDVDTTHRILEYILENYPGDEYNDPDEEYTEEEVELTEEDRAVIDTIVEDLSQQPAMGEDVAEEWESLAQQYSEADPTYAGIAAATSAYHAGEVSAEEAIGWVFNNFNIQDIARVYQHLSSR
jgi:hypothetical protein